MKTDSSKDNPKVGINAQLLSLSGNYRGAGINWYIYNLLRQLGQRDSRYSYTVFLGEPHFTETGLRLQRTRCPTHLPPVRIAWEQFVLPFWLRRFRMDLLHAAAFVAPVATPCPFVVTVYDLSFLRFPAAFRPWNRWYLSRFTATSARRAARVIAISESTKKDVVDLLGVEAGKVDVIYCGVEKMFHPLPEGEVEAFRRAQNLPEEFILFLGTLEPRKNVESLVRAYASWRREKADAPKLVLAGAKGWYYEHIFSLVGELGLDREVIFPGYVAQQSLPLLYNCAGLFVYPSIYEGFGLPVLEAMACGTPVITSNVSSLPEVAGDAALLVDAGNVEQLTQALQRAWSDADLRVALGQNGLRQAASFTWERTAEQTEATYAKAMGKASPNSR